MSGQLTATVVGELTSSVEDLLSIAGSVVSGTQAQFIANGEPESIFGKLQQGAAQQACRRYADNPGVYSGAGATLVENACRPYLDSIGYGGPPEIKVPFQGGQCPVLYRIQFGVFQRFNNSSCTPSPSGPGQVNGILGPITAITPFNPSGTANLCPGSPGQTLRVFHGNGQAFNLLGFGPNGVANFPTVTVVREDGQPDNCGSPPPVLTPPTPPPTPGPRTERFNPSPDVDVDISVEINPDGTISVDFGTGPEVIDPFRPGGDGAGGGGGADPGEPSTPSDTGNGGEAEGEAADGEELVGVLVEVLAAPAEAPRFQSNAARPFRGIGYVRMGYPGRLGVDVSGGTVISPQFFHAQQRGLTAWAVSANVGFNLRVTPYYRITEP